MDVLFVVPYMPNLIRTRPYNLIRHLSERGHRVTLFTLWVNEQEKEQIKHLRQICHEVQALPMPAWQSLWNSLRAVPGRHPLQTVYSWKPKLVSRLNGRSPYDVVHVEHLRGARYAVYLKQHTRLPVVWDSVDCISHLFRQAAAQSKSLLGRLRSRFELGRSAWYEGWLMDKFDHVLVTSPVDRQALQALTPAGATAAPISVLANGVDGANFYANPAVKRDPETLVVSGKMSYHANITMTLYLVKEIMPLVWAQRPSVKLIIAGKDPAREITALAEKPNVIVTGTVPSMTPYLQQATLAVAPITYGAGVQNKVLEAMACATPVIATSRAVSALQAVPGQDLLVADSAADFAAAILDVLDSPETQERLGRNGRHYVKKYHQWPAIAARLETIYQKAMGRLAGKICESSEKKPVADKIAQILVE